MNSTLRMDREQAKEILARVDAATSGATPAEARKTVVQILNRIPRYNWVGIYLVKSTELRLDAWSGPAATVHTTIPIGKGVCGWAAKTGRTEIVSDVSKDPRYLECFANTKSEIVVPIHLEGKVVGEIDIDSDELNAHTSVDREFLEAVAAKVARFCS